MKAKLGLCLFAVLLLSSMAFAVNGSGYYNLITVVQSGGFNQSSTTMVLSQSNVPCSDTAWKLTFNNVDYTSNGKGDVGYTSGWNIGMWGGGMTSFTPSGKCVSSVEDTPKKLHELLKKSWVDNKEMKGVPLELGSDIDLGEFSAETEPGSCDVNHEPLPMMDSTSFSGNGFTVKHLCYAASSMTKPVALFEKVANITIENIKMNGVRIYIDGESGDGKDYYPVGALVGMVSLATVQNIELANDSIQAPFAGGLAGFVKNSTISNITGNDDIYITNKVTITEGYAGSSVMDSVSDHKVFLGGIVGVAYRSEHEDPTFRHDSVKVEIHDFAYGHKSALGGIAGLFSTTGESDTSLFVYTKVKAEETIPSRISGGSSMGGLFGARVVYSEYGSPKAGDYTLVNGSFDGQIYDASSPNVIAVGGLIGLDSAVAGMSVKIMNSSANVDMKDSLKVAGLYSYYAGGILGYGSSCGSGSDNDKDFFSITDVTSTGSIGLSASGKAVEGLHAQAYLGGVAGRVCLAQAKNMGFVNVSSTVDIKSRVKTAVDANRPENGSESRDSLYVGGLIGFLQVATIKTDILSNLSYGGQIDVEDSLNCSAVGGIVGGFPQAYGGKSVHFKNVLVNSDDLITYKAVEGSTTATTLQTAKIGGLCGVCNEITVIERVGMAGDIKVTGKYSGDSLLVGGLVGSTHSVEKVFTLKTSFVVGDIAVSATAKQKKVGYLLGSAMWNGDFNILSNYHYGENDLDVAPFGMISNGMDLTAAWASNDNIHYVVRNGETKTLSVNQNGTEVAETMQTSKFAGFLNKKVLPLVEGWSYKKDENSDLPIFADELINKPIEPDATTFVVTFVDMMGKTVDLQTVKENSAATAPQKRDMPVYEGYTFNDEWDKPFNKITSDLTVKAIYDINYYGVEFFDFDGMRLGDSLVIQYATNVTPPEVPERTGYTFTGWSDSSYLEVKKNLKINAVYEAIKYNIVFKNLDDEFAYSIAYGVMPPELTGVTRPATAEYVYEFVGWKPAVVPVNGDAVYTAVFDSVKVKYPVTFWKNAEEMIGDTLWVDYGAAAVAPKAPEREGYVFVEWDRNFDVITKNTEVMARYERIPESSSSEVASSSSTPENVSSSSETPSSSDAESSSSSSAEESSSSEQPAESSSSEAELKLVAAPKIETSGHAVQLTFKADNVNSATTARVKVIGEYGTIADDTISASVVKGGVWEMVPAPMGKFSVELSLDDHVHKPVVYRDSFEINSEIEVRAESWQMVSLAALANSSVMRDEDASFYWWDEQNPIGDYWQYRAFTGGDVDSTRGFWYGTKAGKPLVLREATGSKDSEIVWELDSLYSGWNLMANPYGWYVDLTKGKTDDGSKVVFWRWDLSIANYVTPTVIGPYEAVWVKAKHATTWRVSAAPYFGITESSSGAKALKKSALRKVGNAPGSFSLVAVLADEYGRQDSWNVLGAGDEERLEEPPAGMGNRVSLAIREEGVGGKKGASLAKSIKAVADEYSWSLEVSASSARDGKLSFEGVSELLKLGLRLFVTVDGNTTEVTGESPVRVALAKSVKRVDVRVAASNAVIASNKLRGLRSVQRGDQMQVSFDAPESVAGANASYAVVGIDGKQVASGRFNATAGTNAFVTAAPKSGVYFVKIKVGAQNMTGKVLVK